METFSIRLQDLILLEVLQTVISWVRLSTHPMLHSSWIRLPQVVRWTQPSRCLKDLVRGLWLQVKFLLKRLTIKRAKELNPNTDRLLVLAINSPTRIWLWKLMEWVIKNRLAKFLRVDKKRWTESAATWNLQTSSRWAVSQSSERIGSTILFRTKRCKILLWQVRLLGMSSCCSVFIMLASITSLSFTSTPSLMVADPWMKCQIKYPSPTSQLVKMHQFSKLVSSGVVKQELSCWQNFWRLRTSSTISNSLYLQDSLISWGLSNKSSVLSASLITKRLLRRVISFLYVFSQVKYKKFLRKLEVL